MSASASGGQQATDGLSGLTGAVADFVVAAGEPGVGVLAALETVFPPIPSEVVLPLAGYLAQRGRLGLAGVLVAAVVGAVLGNLVLYALGRALGEQRAGRLLARLPLMSAEDVREASAWFGRHGRGAVFFGRWVPVVRALVSLPAGAQRMPLPTFLAYTAAGIGTWNGLLVTAGYLLGTQYQLLEEYLGYLDYVFLAALVVLLGLWVRRHRRRAGERVGEDSAPPGS